MQSDGKIIATGFSNTVNGQRIALARYLNGLTAGKSVFDFDGDSKTDIGIFRPNSGEWWINRSSSNQTNAVQFGTSTDKLVPADYTGDGKTDIAFWRDLHRGSGLSLRSEDSSFYRLSIRHGRAIFPRPETLMATAKPMLQSFVRRPRRGIFCALPIMA